MDARASADQDPEVRHGGRSIAVLSAVFAFLLCVFPQSSMDAFWHLRTGELILERGEVPETDWYTYTDADRPWVDLHWVFQVGLAELFAIGGWDLVVLVKAAIVAAAILLLLFGPGRAAPRVSASVLVVLAATVASGQADVRPGVLTLLFLAVALGIARGASTRPRLLLAWIPLMTLWANCQGLFVLGLIVLGAFVLDHAARTVAGGHFGLEPVRTPHGLVAAVLVLSPLACLVTPYGVDGLLFPLELLRKLTVDREAYAIVVEFQQPVDFWRANGGGLAGLSVGFLLPQCLLFLAATASFVVSFETRRWSPFRVIVFVAFSALAWRMLRNSGPFSIAAAAVALENLAARGGVRRPTRRGTTGALLLLTIACIAVAVGWTSRLAGDGRRLALGEPPAWFMRGPAEFAAGDGLPRGAFVSHVGQSAVYTYYAGPERKVFMDGRLEVASRETFRRFLEAGRLMSESDARFEDIVRLPDGSLPAVLLDANFSTGEIAGLLGMPDRWRPVFLDASGAVFLDVATAERLGLREVGR